MPEDPRDNQQDNKQTELDLDIVKKAIETLTGKGWDINPFTVAEESGLDPKDLSRNSDAMKCILEARGGDLTFEEADSKVKHLEDKVNQLESEKQDLIKQLASPSAELLGNPDDINEQVQQLLQSNSDDELKQMEQELEQAYTQSAQLQEENLELTHSITGLEKVNEALNVRMRELEDELAKVKDDPSGQTADPSEKADSKDRDADGKMQALAAKADKLIQENEGLTEKLKETQALTDELKAAQEENEDLKRVNLELETRIIQLENMLAETQQEAETLGVQLQNAFHVAYEKGLQEGAKQALEKSEAPVKEEPPPPPPPPPVPEALTEEATAPNSSDSSAPETVAPAQEAAALASSALDSQGPTAPVPVLDPEAVQTNLEMKANSGPESSPAEEALPEPEPAQSLEPQVAPQPAVAAQPQAAPQPAETAEAEVAAQPASAAAQAGPPGVHNFTQAGPYVSSDFNPLEDMRWRDLETVYSMGVLSVQDFDSNVPSAQSTASVHTPPKDTTLYKEAPQETNEAPKPIDDPVFDENGIPDFDQMDIFEDIEELEALGQIEVPDDLLSDLPLDEIEKQRQTQERLRQLSEAAETATGEELRDLIKSRIQQAQEQHQDKAEVHTPPAPDSENEAEAAKGFPGLNKFVGQKAQPQEAPKEFGGGAPKNPALRDPEIRKACMILGIDIAEELTRENVTKAWKLQIASPGVHPDQGGDTDSAIFLNQAKDTLLRYIDKSSPKLGKKFGGGGGGSSRFTGKKKHH